MSAGVQLISEVKTDFHFLQAKENLFFIAPKLPRHFLLHILYIALKNKIL